MKPLNGVRIIEFDGLGPVTFAGMMLADLGAEVVRLTRDASAGPAVFDEVGGEVLHRGRAAVPVDLKSPTDRERILQLIDGADAVIEGFRPGVMERLGYGPEVLQARKPALVFGRVTGWGQAGPLANAVGHDLNYIGLSGMLHAMGEADRPPAPPLNLVGDYGGGAMLLVVGLLAALVEARTTGKGRVVDAAMTDGAALLGGLFQALRGRGLWSDRRGSTCWTRRALLSLLRLSRRRVRGGGGAGAAFLRRAAGRLGDRSGRRGSIRHRRLAGPASAVCGLVREQRPRRLERPFRRDGSLRHARA